MKKEYIRPESKLFAINLAENIAESTGGSTGGTTGGDNQLASGHVMYTLNPDGKSGYLANNTAYTFTLWSGDDDHDILMAYFGHYMASNDIADFCWIK